MRSVSLYPLPFSGTIVVCGAETLACVFAINMFLNQVEKVETTPVIIGSMIPNIGGMFTFTAGLQSDVLCYNDNYWLTTDAACTTNYGGTNIFITGTSLSMSRATPYTMESAYICVITRGLV
jgi:hypothetical protein